MTDNNLKQIFEDWMKLDQPESEDELLELLTPYIRHSIYESLLNEGRLTTQGALFGYIKEAYKKWEKDYSFEEYLKQRLVV